METNVADPQATGGILAILRNLGDLFGDGEFT